MCTPEYDPFPNRPKPMFWWTCPECKKDNDASKCACSKCGTLFPIDVKRWMAHPPEPPQASPKLIRFLERIRPVSRWLIILVGVIFTLDILRVLFGDLYLRLAAVKADPFFNLILPRFLLMFVIQGCIIIAGWSWRLREKGTKKVDR